MFSLPYNIFKFFIAFQITISYANTSKLDLGTTGRPSSEYETLIQQAYSKTSTKRCQLKVDLLEFAKFNPPF